MEKCCKIADLKMSIESGYLEGRGGAEWERQGEANSGIVVEFRLN